MKNYLLRLRYDGTQFHGWQRQANARTVQGELERALDTIFDGVSYRLSASSRTDAGVHALRHPVSLETDARIPPDGLLKGLNSLLPHDVSVREVLLVPSGFDAKKMALSKTYVYRILEDRIPNPFEERYAWRLPYGLDLDAMRLGAAYLLGEHDFSAFRSAQCDAKSPWRQINALVVAREGRIVTLTVNGNAFLRSMVRVIVGSLVRVGAGRESPEWISHVLESHDRTRAGLTAPARGLFLADVSFPPDLIRGSTNF